MDEPILAMCIVTRDEEECMRIGSSIHDQLVGNKDYIDSNILLNCTDYPCEVRLYIYEECKEIPKITLF